MTEVLWALRLCSHNFNVLRCGFDLGFACTVNCQPFSHSSVSSLRCLSVSIFFLTLQLLLYPILQSSCNPLVLILQAVAMEIIVISQIQCCKHCRRQWKRWLANRYSEDTEGSLKELFLTLSFGVFCPLSIFLGFQCVWVLFLFFIFKVYFLY